MGLLPDVDPDGLLEYSVVFTDRSLNHMSAQFQQVMRDLYRELKQVYQAEAMVLVPGGGTYAMESVARQFAKNKRCLVIRNGWFSFRWTQIFDMADIPASCTVLRAEQQSHQPQAPFAPAAIEDVVATIKAEKPDLVFAPHVETASGILLPDDYIQQLAEAVHAYGGMLVLDCVASGTLWIEMKNLGVDILISAPQKGWSASPCCGIVMLGETALSHLPETQSDSFACDLKKWHDIMQAYENGGHAYHATLPTDSLKKFRDTLLEMKKLGFSELKQAQLDLGNQVRALFAQEGYQSVAADGFAAPGVAVFYTDKPEMQTGKPFLEKGVQIAAGVPLQCDEPESFKTFRIGLFGVDKLLNIEDTVGRLKATLAKL